MATASAAPQRRSSGREVPARDGQDRPRIRVVDSSKARRQSVVGRRRMVAILGASTIAGALLVVAISQAMVASQQVRLDNLNGQLSASVAKNENLQLEKAQLATPTRILHLAETKLGMIAPTNVIYLSPVNPGPSLGTASEAATK